MTGDWGLAPRLGAMMAARSTAGGDDGCSLNGWGRRTVSLHGRGDGLTACSSRTTSLEASWRRSLTSLRRRVTGGSLHGLGRRWLLAPRLGATMGARSTAGGDERFLSTAGETAWQRAPQGRLHLRLAGDDLSLLFDDGWLFRGALLRWGYAATLTPYV